MSSTPVLLEALRSMGKASAAQPPQQPLIPPVPPLANASPPPPQACPPSTEAVKAMLAAAAAAAAAGAAGPAQPSAPAPQPPSPKAAPQPNASLTADSHAAAAPSGSSPVHDASLVADKAQPKEQLQRAAVPAESDPDASASAAVGNETDSPVQQLRALKRSLPSASAEHPAEVPEPLVPEPQLLPSEQAPGSKIADEAFDAASARAQTAADTVEGAKGALSMQQTAGSKQSDELQATASGPPQAAVGVSPADVAAPAPKQTALVDPPGAGTASLPKLPSISRETADAVDFEQQELASSINASDGATA